jgi:hypothetical protein
MAMRIMGWLSPEMIRVYERELEKARGEADKRSLEIINSIDELELEIPKINTRLKPTKEPLETFIQKYSNITIGKIYMTSEATIRKYIKQYEIARKTPIKPRKITDKQIKKIRQSLMEEYHG